MFSIILFILAILLLLLAKTPSKGVIIYGDMGCGWTRKQLEETPGAQFVDCSKTQCPSWVTGFPGVQLSDGTQWVGYKNITYNK